LQQSCAEDFGFPLNADAVNESAIRAISDAPKTAFFMVEVFIVVD